LKHGSIPTCDELNAHQTASSKGRIKRKSDDRQDGILFVSRIFIEEKIIFEERGMTKKKKFS
jgi:hypothetical protein